MLHRGCGKTLVGGLMIRTDFAVGIVLRTCPLAGGSVILLCLFMDVLVVSMGWLGCKRSSMG